MHLPYGGEREGADVSRKIIYLGFFLFIALIFGISGTSG
jgi:hypothetical protein